MRTLRHLIIHIKKNGLGNKTFFAVAFMILFWAIFEGIISFVAPIAITERGISNTVMGMIIGSSSIAGALFDFLLCRYLKNLNHRRLLLFMFILSFIVPLILWQATTVYIYLIAMAVWGLFFDLQNIADFEYVGCNIEKDAHSSTFGVLQVFKSFAYLIAPIVAALAIGEFIDSRPFVSAWFFLFISLIFFVIYQRISRDETKRINSEFKKVNLLHEFSLWQTIGRVIFPILVLTFLLNVVDSFFWTIGPLVSESLGKFRHFGGFFMSAWTLPPLFVGWIAGYVTSKYGKKKTAFYSFLLGSILLIPFFLFSNVVILSILVLASSFLMSFSWPSINGAYADYISESKSLEREIEGLGDFFANIGYVIGPVMAGLFSDLLGNNASFSVMGGIGVAAAILLLKITPKAINLSPKKLLEEAKSVFPENGSAVSQ